MSAPCPICRTLDTSVLRSCHGRRERKCGRCGHRWQTVEVDAERLARWERAESAMRDAVDALGRG